MASRKLVVGGSVVVAFALSIVISHPWTGMPQSRRECPLTDSIVVDTPFVTVPTSVIPASGAITHVPEFHDCQRFLLASPVWQIQSLNRLPFVWLVKKTYDSLFAVFASESLSARWRAETTIVVLPPTRDPISGELVVGKATTRITKPDSGVYVLFAEIVSWGGTYDRLGIGRGFNCLYLRGPENPSAKMVQYGKDEPSCASSLMTGEGEQQEQKDLEVNYVPAGAFGPGDFPPVARWDWDSTSKEHFITMRCGTGWCEVGSMRFVGSVAAFDAGSPSGRLRRVSEIRGWYDEQRLAVGPHQLNASSVRAIAVPDSGLDAYTESDFNKHWTPTARIWISEPSETYAEKLNLGVKHPRGAYNQISVCRGVRSDCSGLPDELVCLNQAGAPASASDTLWWARITRAWIGPGSVQLQDTSLAYIAQPTAYRCLKRFDHPELTSTHIPGTVRWRWQAHDETVWMRCAQGCCEVQ